MYKVLWVLMPLFAFIGLVLVLTNYDINFYTLLKEFKEIDFVKLDYSKVKNIFDGLDFESIWSNVGDAWSNVNDISSFFSALGSTFTGVFDTLTALFQVVVGFAVFIYQFLKFFVINLYLLFNYSFTYIFR